MMLPRKPSCFRAACTVPRLGSQAFASCSQGILTPLAYQVFGPQVGELFTLSRKSTWPFSTSCPCLKYHTFLFCLTDGESLKDQPDSARPRWICLPSHGHRLSGHALFPCCVSWIRLPALELDLTQLSHQPSELLYLDLPCLS